MKKGLLIVALLVLLIVGGAWYLLSGTGNFIRAQIEEQGSKYLGTTVSVGKVEVALIEGHMSISELSIDNPPGFSNEEAFSVDAITFDLGEVITEPYVVQMISVDAAKFLYEVDAEGKGNLIALKNNLATNLPKTENDAPAQDGSKPLVIVEKITVSNVRLKINFEQMPTGDLKIDTKTYDVTLPTFNAGPIGQPEGIPADQVGIAVANVMLEKVIAAAKSEVKKRLADEAKKKVKDKLKSLLDIG